jgi:hypothetical protein
MTIVRKIGIGRGPDMFGGAFTPARQRGQETARWGEQMNRHSNPVCRSILLAFVLSVSFASSGEPSAQAVADARVACASDIQKLCAGVSPGGGGSSPA